MDMLQTTAVLTTLAAALAFINARLLKLPTTIGLMVLSFLMALGMLFVGWLWPGAPRWVETMMEGVDFSETVMHGMLGFLLFAGALHVNINDLRSHQWAIGALVTAGVVSTTLIVGVLTKLITGLLGLEVAWVYCFLFGALIAPTDPIAVLAVLKTLGAPKPLETKIAGESLFNDGVGVVVFLALLGLAGLGGHPDKPHAAAEGPGTVVTVEQAAETAETAAVDVLWLFTIEAGGGVIAGLALGFLGYWMIKRLDDYKTEVLISIAMVVGGYGLCDLLHVSAPIAMVVAGLIIGNHGRALAMSETTRKHLDTFWELIDEILNAVLFVLIGLEVLVLKFGVPSLLAGAAAIPAVLLARWISISGLAWGMRAVSGRRFMRHTVTVLTWAGLRGGISVALALSLHDQAARGGGAEARQAADVVVAMTYVVVVFSIIGQGLTIGPMLRRLGLTGDAQTAH